MKKLRRYSNVTILAEQPPLWDLEGLSDRNTYIVNRCAEGMNCYLFSTLSARWIGGWLEGYLLLAGNSSLIYLVVVPIACLVYREEKALRYLYSVIWSSTTEFLPIEIGRRYRRFCYWPVSTKNFVESICSHKSDREVVASRQPIENELLKLPFSLGADNACGIRSTFMVIRYSFIHFVCGFFRATI